MATAERPKVLIVDDQPRNLDALEAMLAPAECVLVRAQSADEALLSLLRHEFAAIVLDIRMPGMTGIELAQLIKQRKRSQHIPILFLTAHTADESDILRGYGVGCRRLPEQAGQPGHPPLEDRRLHRVVPEDAGARRPERGAAA